MLFYSGREVMKNSLITLQSNNIALFDESIKKNLQDFFADIDAYSLNTQKQFKSAIHSWSNWCKQNNKIFLPISPDDLRDYLVYLKEERHLKHNSINSHNAFLAMLQNQSGLTPINASSKVKRIKKKLLRMAINEGEELTQAIPFRFDDLKQLYDLKKDSLNLKDIRDLAILATAYYTLLRSSEITRIKVKDFKLQRNGKAILHISHTKTVLTIEGLYKHLGKLPTKLIQNWIDMSGVDLHKNAYLFCAIKKSNEIQRPNHQLTTETIRRVFNSSYRLINTVKRNQGDRYMTWSAHSARVGAAIDMAERNVGLTQIMHEGTWKKPEMVIRYIRKLESEDGPMQEFDIEN